MNALIAHHHRPAPCLADGAAAEPAVAAAMKGQAT